MKEMNGITLAESIRAYDPRGFIVFITADADSLMLTFKYKLEAMDYIVKDVSCLKTRIRECLYNAFEKYTTKDTPLQNNFVFKLSKDEIISLDSSKILYFESSPSTPHNVIVYTENSRYQFREKLTHIEKELNASFFRCHRSFIVNIEKIARLDTALLKLQLKNGTSIDIAAKYIKKAKEFMSNTGNN
jgi:two-component system response regulator AgrA